MASVKGLRAVRFQAYCYWLCTSSRLADRSVTDWNNICNEATQGNIKLPFQWDLPITWFERGHDKMRVWKKWINSPFEGIFPSCQEKETEPETKEVKVTIKKIHDLDKTPDSGLIIMPHPTSMKTLTIKENMAHGIKINSKKEKSSTRKEYLSYLWLYSQSFYAGHYYCSHQEPVSKLSISAFKRWRTESLDN